jgi:hypothetical protein
MSHTHYDLHIDIGDIFPKNSTFNGLLPHGGVGLTILINLFFCSLLFGLFVFVLRPCLPLFNLKKKKQLSKQVRQLSKMYYANTIAVGNEKQETDVETAPATTEEKKIQPEYNYFKNLLDLSDEEEEEIENEEDDLASSSTQPEVVAPNETSSQKLARLRDSSKKRVKYWWVVTKELLYLVKRVTLSLISRKHNNDDMQHLFNRYSRDVATYLLFEKEIITALIFCSILATIILLPLHLTYVCFKALT